MERLVISYQYGDGYSYSGTDTIAIEFESKRKLEDAILDIVQEEIRNRNKEKFSYSFKLSDHEFEFDFDNFIQHGNELAEEFPKIQTLDEWFEENKVSGINLKTIK